MGPAAGLSILSVTNTRAPAEQMGHGTRDQELHVEPFEMSLSGVGDIFRELKEMTVRQLRLSLRSSEMPRL